MHYLWWHGMALHCMRASEEERRGGALDWIGLDWIGSCVGLAGEESLILILNGLAQRGTLDCHQQIRRILEHELEIRSTTQHNTTILTEIVGYRY